jgi:hypothetical protein
MESAGAVLGSSRASVLKDAEARLEAPLSPGFSFKGAT